MIPRCYLVNRFMRCLPVTPSILKMRISTGVLSLWPQSLEKSRYIGGSQLKFVDQTVENGIAIY
jgi:hypothetical protein